MPVRETIAASGRSRISDGFISPLDLVTIGLLGAEEAQELRELQTPGAQEHRDRELAREPGYVN